MRIRDVLATDAHLIPWPLRANKVMVNDGRTVALHRDHCDQIIWRRLRQTSKTKRYRVLRDLDGFTGLQQSCRERLHPHSADCDYSLRLKEGHPFRCRSTRRPEVDVDVKRIAFAREVVVVAEAD